MSPRYPGLHIAMELGSQTARTGPSNTIELQGQALRCAAKMRHPRSHSTSPAVTINSASRADASALRSSITPAYFAGPDNPAPRTHKMAFRPNTSPRHDVRHERSRLPPRPRVICSRRRQEGEPIRLTDHSPIVANNLFGAGVDAQAARTCRQNGGNAVLHSTARPGISAHQSPSPQSPPPPAPPKASLRSPWNKRSAPTVSRSVEPGPEPLRSPVTSRNNSRRPAEAATRLHAR